jgi:hypothetical protein
MGLFDFFKRKKAAAPEDPLPGLDDDRPRCHHYTFAHLALRQVAFDEPLTCLGVLASPQAREFLADLWGSVCEHCARMGEKPDFTADDIRVHTLRAGGYPCAVLEMPAPRGVTEVHYAALLLLVDTSREEAPAPEDVRLRYVTLEKGWSDGPPVTVLCEWTKDGTHRNHGSGPPAELGAFLEAVAGLANK